MYQRLFLLEAGEEVKGSQVARAFFGKHFRVFDDHREHHWSLFRAGSPNNVAASGRLPILEESLLPFVEVRIPIVVRADAEGFEIPTILAVVLHREFRPEFEFCGIVALANCDRQLATDLWIAVVRQIGKCQPKLLSFGSNLDFVF